MTKQEKDQSIHKQDSQSTERSVILSLKNLTIRIPQNFNHSGLESVPSTSIDNDAHGSKSLVNNLSFELYKGETLAIVGESGSGKSISTLAILGLLPDSLHVDGTLSLNVSVGLSHNVIELPITQSSLYQNSISPKIKKSNTQLWKQVRGQKIGMIFQEPMTALNPLHSVGKQIAESLTLAGLAKPNKSELTAQIIELLNQVNIKDAQSKLTRFPHELSGGQRQRVMIAMALAQQPEVLIADEPTTALDVTLQHEILGLLESLKQQHDMSLILISHDLNLVQRYSKQIVVMKAGETIEQGATDTLFANPEAEYTKSLMYQNYGQPIAVNAHTDKSSAHDTDLNNIAPKIVNEVMNLGVKFPMGKTLFGGVVDWFNAVEDISFTLEQGKSLGIVGESGSGKTTTALAITRLLTRSTKTEGKVTIDTTDVFKLTKKELCHFRSKVQMVFQDPFASLNPRFTILQIIEEGLKTQGVASQQRKEAVIKALESVHLPTDFIHRYPHQLSGGQRQRVALARALVLKPKLIILDEPTSALDSSTQVAVVELLREIQSEYNVSFIFISHDLKVVQALCHDIMVMKAGVCVEYSDAMSLFNNPQHEYSKQLIERS